MRKSSMLRPDATMPERSDDSLVQEGEWQWGAPLLSFRYSYRELSSLDGKTHAKLIFNTPKNITSVYHRVTRAREERGTTDIEDLELAGLRGCHLLELAYGGRQSHAHGLEHFAARPFGLGAQAEVFLLVHDLNVL